MADTKLYQLPYFVTIARKMCRAKKTALIERFFLTKFC